MKNIIINGKTYNGVNSVDFKQVEGGRASFVDGATAGNFGLYTVKQKIYEDNAYCDIEITEYNPDTDSGADVYLVGLFEDAINASYYIMNV